MGLGVGAIAIYEAAKPAVAGAQSIQRLRGREAARQQSTPPLVQTPTVQATATPSSRAASTPENADIWKYWLVGGLSSAGLGLLAGLYLYIRGTDRNRRNRL